MNILNFVSSLLPSFKKDKLLEDLEVCTAELQNVVLPSYRLASSAITTLRSKQAKDFERLWASRAKDTKKGPMLASIHLKLEQVLPTLDLIGRYATKDFEEVIITQGLTIKKSTIIKLLEVADWANTYALKFLNYLYTLEIKEVSDTPSQLAGSLTPGEINVIETSFNEFIYALNALSKKPDQLEKILEKAPDILVKASSEATLALAGQATDQTGVFSLKGFIGSPIYRVGLIIAEYQATRYKRNKELKTLLELRLLNLQQQQSGNPDSAVEKEIEILQSRIEALDEKIRKAEESVR